MCQYSPATGRVPISAASLAGAGLQLKQVSKGNGGRRTNTTAVSFPRRVEGYSGRLTVATGNNSTRIFSSLQTQTPPLQWCAPVTGIAPKHPRSETGSSQSGLRPILDLRPIDRALHKRIQDDDTEADPGADPSRGLVRFSGFKGRVLPYSNGDAPQALPEICF